ncbi:MAG: aldolase/citrate lyase family protein [Trueperaceae bacterium]
MPKRSIQRLLGEWRKQRTTTNAWLTIPNGFVAEMASRAGFDSICVDMQHGLIDFTQALSMLQATLAKDVPTFVRAPWNEPSILMRLLDAGADGVIVPMVDNAEQAEVAVSACRYPPRGKRSSGPMRAALVAEEPYFPDADANCLVFVMIESTAALENLEPILDTPGLSGVYIGPADLSLSMGFPPETDCTRPEHQAAIKRVIDECHKRSLFVGLHTAGPPFARLAAGWGVDLVTIATDSSSLKMELARRVAEYAKLAG